MASYVLYLISPDLRRRIARFQIVNETDVSRVHFPGESPSGGTACILASMQPTHATSDMVYAEERLGPERLHGAYAWESVLQSGATALPFGSDWPTVGVVPPLLGIYAAITREDLDGHPPGGWTPWEKVSREHALRGYTMDAAFAGFQEKMIGSLAVGKYADFIALDRDVLDAAATPDAQIWQAAVLGTWSGGEQAWAHPCWSAGRTGTLSEHAQRAHAGDAARSHVPRSLGALRQCVEATRQAEAAANGESELERFRRLAKVAGDGCPF